MQPFDGRAADELEAVIHRIRLTLLVLVLARLVVFFGGQMAAGATKHWLTSGFILAGIGGSFAVREAVRRSVDKEPALAVSAGLDALLAFLIVAPSVFWPRPTYAGMLLAPDFAIWSMVVIGAGFRLSRRAALVGTTTAACGLGALLAVDQVRNAASLRYGTAEIGLAAVFVLGAAAMALGVGDWIRALVARGAAEAVRAERARNRLGAYVSTEIAERALSEDAVLGGEARDVAILFSDLRGFTRMAEDAPPDVLIADLNAYLEAMVAVIHRHGGVVDKYMGDAILAVFGLTGAQVPGGNAPARAIAAARDMMAALEVHNVSRAAAGKPGFAHGVGVHHGRVIAGHVGTPERLQYTVIGDAVNVAARLQTATKELGLPVLVSDDALRLAEPRPPMTSLPPLSVRGRAAAIGIHTPA